MGGKRIAAAIGVVVGAGLLTGCCLFSGTPTVTIGGPSTATTGTPVTFTATATGGSAPYTYTWSFGGSGSTVTHTFTSTGGQTIGCTVTDSCGKLAQAMWTVTVSEGTGGGNLTGMWSGTMYDPGGNSYILQLQITHVGTNVTATVYFLSATTQGSGSYAAGQFFLNFQWPYSTLIATLSGTYNPYADELSGDLIIGGTKQGSWRVRR
ncbi:PKD domain-containing protein [Candidatus Bipolaricaulota bacterium]|nr:PKD domain-containing protein [Candidatus Bipolaricaulota bacterium]